MTVSKNSNESRIKINIADKVSMLPFTIIAAIPFIILVAELTGFRGLAKALPDWSKWSWIGLAYFCCFLACRNLGAGSRKPKTAIFSAKLERQLQTSVNFMATLCAFGLSTTMAIGAATMAPERITLVAPLFFILPVFFGLLCGDKYGFFHLHLKRVTVVV